jgi:hypothetical protein
MEPRELVQLAGNLVDVLHASGYTDREVRCVIRLMRRHLEVKRRQEDDPGVPRFGLQSGEN